MNNPAISSALITAIESRVAKLVHKCRFHVLDRLRALIPAAVWQYRCQAMLADFEDYTPSAQAAVRERVAYYNQLNAPVASPSVSEQIGNFSSKGKSSAYCADFRYFMRFFPSRFRLSYLFGDVTHVPDEPRFLKSRPIREDRSNANSILLKLNTIRHYYFVQDRLGFSDKKSQAVWRGKSNHPDRVAFAQRYMNHPQCNIGCVRHKEKRPEAYLREFLSIEEQLKYQFIVSVEGVDVATNLKWIMASNSLCLMRRPRYETWFMEGRLIPDQHYVLLDDDYSDLPEKMAYYRDNPREAQQIIANANRHVAQFMDEGRECLIALLVIEKYLQLSGQVAGRGSRSEKPAHRLAKTRREIQLQKP